MYTSLCSVMLLTELLLELMGELEPSVSFLSLLPSWGKGRGCCKGHEARSIVRLPQNLRQCQEPTPVLEA